MAGVRSGGVERRFIDMKREMVDLTNLAFGMGKMGRLTTLNMVPVVAGDSISLDVGGLMRFTPLRRQLVQDAQVDILTCFVPHRHIYSNWETFVTQGQDETQDLQTVDAGTGNSWDEFAAIPWMHSGEVPLWAVQGYCNI